MGLGTLTCRGPRVGILPSYRGHQAWAWVPAAEDGVVAGRCRPDPGSAAGAAQAAAAADVVDAVVDVVAVDVDVVAVVVVDAAVVVAAVVAASSVVVVPFAVDVGVCLVVGGWVPDSCRRVLHPAPPYRSLHSDTGQMHSLFY